MNQSMNSNLDYFERKELEDRELGGTVRECEYGDHRVRLRFIDRWECSDGSVHDKWNEALEHEKSINVRARHRDEVPVKRRTWITSDGKEFPDWIGEQCKAYYEAIDHQQALNDRQLCKQLAEIIWQCRPILSEEMLADNIERHFTEIKAVLGPTMMPMM